MLTDARAASSCREAGCSSPESFRAEQRLPGLRRALPGGPVWRAAALLGALLLGAGSAWAQSGTLQLPEHHVPDRAPPPPKAAPRTPVHRVEPRFHATPHNPQPHHPTPVVTAHPPTHGHPPPHGHPPAGKPEPHKPEPHKPEAKQPPHAAPSKPVTPPEPDKGTSTGLPLPRFAALRSDEVNLRTGPGTRYPIEWVYKRRNLPVEIQREFDVWRLVEDSDGIRGWVHQATLIGRRSFEVEHQDATLRASPQETAAAVAILKPGVIGRIRSCHAGSDWCRVQVGSYGGYLPRSSFWGTLPGEVVR